MKATRFKISGIDYSYHPDFVQDDTDPRGYRLLGTGKYVVEWNAREFHKISLLAPRLHYKRDFLTKDAAERWIKTLKQGLDEHQAIVIDNDNGYYLGQ